jgi:chaperonin cofactor prefoldin
MFPFRRTDKLVQEIEKQGNVYFLLNAFIGAYNRRTDVLAKGTGGDVSAKLDEILEAVRGVQLPDVGFINAKLDLTLELLEGDNGVIKTITNLQREVSESMATQEERLRTIQGQMTSIADGINKLQAQLADLKVNNPELDDEISAIETTAKEIGEDLNPSTPAPTEPPV